MRLMLTNMKNSLVFLALLCINSAFGQITDGFNDGDFTNNPTWVGSGFQVNATQQLQTSSSGGLNQTVNLITQNAKVLNVVWEFYVQMNFDPSANNQMRIYLISDKTNLSADLNGYFLQIGESGSTDSYDLYRQDGLVTTKIIDGPPKTRVSNTQLLARVRISRNIAGVWNIETDITGGTNYVSEGTQTDLTHLITSWFGIQCKYTSTNSDKFYFDDLTIDHLMLDNIPPQLLSAKGVDVHTVEVTFHEPVSLETALNIINYNLKDLNQDYGTPSTAKKTDMLNTFLLEFVNELNTNSYNIKVNNMTDFNFNTQQNSNSASYYYEKPYVAQAKDILINEIFADPSPQIDLPSVEFIELWNTTDFPISVQNWTYSDGTSTATIGNVSLDPHEFVILCALTDVPNFTLYGKVIGSSTWPSLNNASDMLVLKNDKGVVMDQVNYADIWYKDALKKQGGYSLELINPKAICTGIQNWGASSDISGGTPGKINSIYQAGTNPAPLQLLSVTVLDSVTLSLKFNRFIDSTSAVVPSHYNLNNGVGQPISGVAVAPNFTEVQLKFAAPLSRGLTYTLSSNQVSDCSGVLIQVPNNSTDFFLPQKILVGDLLLSEILFNPKVGGVDFVEIYNNTDHPLDLKDLGIASADDQDKLISLKAVSGVNNLIPAKSYRVLSTDTDYILANYTVNQPNTLVKVVALPSFNDDTGVAILVRDSMRIDQFNYSDKMHFALLSNTEGVSLERSLFSLAANTPGNFRSAAAAVGFATPGYQNSQFLEGVAGANEINLSSATLSPDNDGFEDALTILYHWQTPGWIANVLIFTEQGQMVRNLIKNQTMGTEGAWVWDGLNDQAERVPIGIYILKIQVFNTSGQVKNYTKTCVLATKLN
jgi:hypothetical protein